MNIPERNRLLAALPRDEYMRLLPHLEVGQMRVRQRLALPDEAIDRIHFPRDAVVSMLVLMENGRSVATTAVGNEGMIGLEVFLGNGLARVEIIVQVPGEGVSLSAGVRRASVSQAAEGLQRTGLIAYRQGWIHIMDRDRLEEAACEDYRLSRVAYDQLY